MNNFSNGNQRKVHLIGFSERLWLWRCKFNDTDEKGKTRTYYGYVNAPQDVNGKTVYASLREGVFVSVLRRTEIKYNGRTQIILRKNQEKLLEYAPS